MVDYIKFLTALGVKLFRLDAFGYTTKRIGTSCFLVEPDVYDILNWIDALAREHGAEALPEVHDHANYQYEVALHALHPYGFDLAAVLLSALLERRSTLLTHGQIWRAPCRERVSRSV